MAPAPGWPTLHPTTTEAATSTTWPAAVAPSIRPRRGANRVARRPLNTAPRTNATRAAAEDPMEKPLAPHRAKARNTTLPVMLATNTCPRAR